MRRMNLIIGFFALAVGSANSTAADLASFSNAQSVNGLKDALRQGAVNAVATLGRQNGFLDNAKVRIPLPGPLAKGEKLMRAVGMGSQADELVVAMNRAAEAAVVEAKSLLVGAVKQMSVADAKGILTGGEDSATRYFRTKTESTLRGKFLPIVTRTTQKVGLAQQYDQFAGRLASTGLISGDEVKIENYVTQKALDGLYLMMAEQERAFRENPLQAGTSLAVRIFQSLRQ
jgi:Protein of unknown function (DUF4197)